MVHRVVMVSGTLLDRVAGNLAVAALMFAPLVVAVGLMTDQPRRPGQGMPARGGIQATLQLEPPVLRPTI